MLFSATHAQDGASLDDAYRAELSRLDTEKNAIKDAIERNRVEGKKTKNTLGSEIEALSRELTRLRAENNSSEMQLPHVSRLHSLESQERHIDRRSRQIETWLEMHGLQPTAGPGKTPTPDGRHEHPPLDRMIQSALEHVQEHGQLWVKTNQEYFRSDGTSTEGPVLRIAEVGAMAIEPDFNALTLASDGSLRVVQDDGKKNVNHGSMRTVNVLLFDPAEPRVLKGGASSWRDWLNRGGAVMWVIAALALIALLVLLERLIAFVRFSRTLGRIEGNGGAVDDLLGKRLLRAVAVVKTGEGTAEKLETEAAEALIQTQPYVRQALSFLAVVASVAPLLGLLGTVTGMIGTFGLITEHGTGDARLLSGGISEALLTTQFGLMVSIPALLAHSIAHRIGDMILKRVERAALEQLNRRFPYATMSQSSNVGPVDVESA
ncbi:MAG: MotA/TolQ/ExbB proton channel family protein [Bradymonadia bacterium]